MSDVRLIRPGRNPPLPCTVPSPSRRSPGERGTRSRRGPFAVPGAPAPDRGRRQAGHRRPAHPSRGDETVAQAKSPHDGDDPLLSRTASTEDGQATRREGRLRRAISRMVRAYEPPETEQGFPVHQPMHRHSQKPDADPSGTGGEGATGPYSGSAEDGHRSSAPASAPNPYTIPRTDADDGTAQIGTWRGVGPDESEPRSPQPPATTTDTMTDTPFPAENDEHDDRRGQPAPGYTAAPDPGRSEERRVGK